MVLETLVNSDELNVMKSGEQHHKQGQWFSYSGITVSTDCSLDDFTSRSPARRRLMRTTPERHEDRQKSELMKLTQVHTAGKMESAFHRRQVFDSFRPQRPQTHSPEGSLNWRQYGDQTPLILLHHPLAKRVISPQGGFNGLH